MYTQDKPDLEYLAHYGVKGMKWGRTRGPRNVSKRQQKKNAKTIDSTLKNIGLKEQKKDLERNKKQLTQLKKMGVKGYAKNNNFDNPESWELDLLKGNYKNEIAAKKEAVRQGEIFVKHKSALEQKVKNINTSAAKNKKIIALINSYEGEMYDNAFKEYSDDKVGR